MKVIYNAMETTWPADIVDDDDDDVRAFIFENFSRSWKIPLCVTSKQKVFSLEDNDDPIQTWTRANFDGKRYNIMTTSIAKCLNAITRDARKLPITQFLEYLRMNIL